jgi:hypothetical protein
MSGKARSLARMSQPRYHWPIVLSLAWHTAIVFGLMLVGERKTETIEERRHEAAAELREAQEAEEERIRQEEHELQAEELSDTVLEELETLLQDALAEDARAQVRNESERFLAQARREAGTLESISPLAQPFFEHSITNLQQYLARLSERMIVNEVAAYIRRTLAPAFDTRACAALQSQTAPLIATSLNNAIAQEARTTKAMPSHATIFTATLPPLARQVSGAMDLELREKGIEDIDRQLLAKVREELLKIEWSDMTIVGRLSTPIRDVLAENILQGAPHAPAVSNAFITFAAEHRLDDARGGDLPEVAGAVYEGVAPKGAASTRASIRAAYRHIVADLALAPGVAEQLRRLDTLAGKLARFDDAPQTFRLGHSTVTYDEATRELEEGEGPHMEHEEEGPDSGHGMPMPAGPLGTSLSELQSGASSGGESESTGHAAFEDRYNRYARVNHDTYDIYRAFVSRRQTNVPPGAALVENLADVAVSRAAATSKLLAERVFVEDGEQRQRASTDGRTRKLSRPRFETLAFGAAAFQRASLTIDGDLGDWGALRHPFRMRWTFNGVPLEDGIQVWVRWSRAGFYYCYRVPGRTQVQPNQTSAWEGDCFEVWIDMQNLRKRTMHRSPYAQQFCLMPFGYRGAAQQTFIEVGRGFRGLGRYENRLETVTDPARARGLAAGRLDAAGYTVEGFVGRAALARPHLRAGLYVAMNISINMGFAREISQQWSLPKNMQTFDKPDTWGDVLLLGTDATVRFTHFRRPAKAARPIQPGQSIGIEVTDQDMNLLPTRRDRVMVAVKERSARSYIYAILEETGEDTGVFRGSVATQAAFKPPRANTLGVHGGRTLEVVYKDRFTPYGEKNRTVECKMRMAAPVLTLQRMATAAAPIL